MVLPSWLNLDSLSLIRMSSLIVSLSIALYLFRLKGRSTPTLFLAWTFLGASLFNFSTLMEFACPTYWQPANLKNLLIPFPQNLGPSTAAVALLLFAYSFPHFQKPDRRERRLVLTFAVAANLFTLSLAVTNFLFLQRRRSSFRLEMPYYILFYSLLAIQFFLVVIILLRKTVRFSTDKSRPWWRKLLRPAGGDALAARSLALVLLLLPLALVGYSLMTMGIFPPSVASYLVWLLFILFYFSMILVYFNHTSERTTLQLKLVGLVLVFVLVVLGLVGLMVGLAVAGDYRIETLTAPGRTVRFTPNPSGGYDVAEVPHRFDPELGPLLDIGYGKTETLSLPFVFPFCGRAYGEIQVLHGPMIYLGADIREDGWGGYHPQPAIAPLITNLSPAPGGGIYARSGPEGVTVTWYRLSEYGRADTNTIQLTLLRDGSFTFSYQELNIHSGYSAVRMYVYTTANVTGLHPGAESEPVPWGPKLAGVHPGRADAPLVPVRFAGGLPYSSAGPAVLFEDYEADFFRALHNRMSPLMLIQIAASLCILFLLPLLLKTSLIDPLAALYRGMERADRGDLEVSLDSLFNDEIGALSRYFTKMLRSIKKAEANFRALAENALDSILIIDGGDRVVFANKRACELIGCSEGDLQEVRFHDLVPGGGEARPAARQVETRLISRRGGRVPVEVTLSRTTWQGGPARVVILRDIRKRLRREAEASERRQRLRQTDKLTSLGVLTTVMAHQINIPNQAILANAALLKRAGPQLRSLLKNSGEAALIAGLEPGEFSRNLTGMLADIEAGSRRIDGIVTNLKDFCRSPPHERMSPVDLNAVIGEAVELVSSYIRGATDRFLLSLEPGLPDVRGNARWLEQVIVNLLLNACQALPDKEKAISLTSGQVRRPRAVRIVVRDEGRGIPAGDLPRITERFFTTKYDAGGTGLGLYVSQEIVNEHRGTLSFSSRPGKGTEAVITLPVEEP